MLILRPPALLGTHFLGFSNSRVAACLLVTHDLLAGPGWNTVCATTMRAWGAIDARTKENQGPKTNTEEARNCVCS
jgi:hypothetical protein